MDRDNMRIFQRHVFYSVTRDIGVVLDVDLFIAISYDPFICSFFFRSLKDLLQYT